MVNFKHLADLQGRQGATHYLDGHLPGEYDAGNKGSQKDGEIYWGFHSHGVSKMVGLFQI